MIQSHVYKWCQETSIFYLITETGAITMSTFPTPIRGKQGKDYKFPRAHCNMKQCKPKECLTNGYGQTTKTFFKGIDTSEGNN